jgi:hypothetical protein
VSQVNHQQGLHEGDRFPSPFERILALGYYDGPTEGLVQEATHGAVYAFRMLAWDHETQDLRIYALSPLPSETLTDLIAAYASYQAPHWPCWVPAWQQELEPPTSAALQRASPPSWIVVTEDLLGEILAARAVSGRNLDHVTDWNAFLGLGRKTHMVSVAGLFEDQE